MLLKSSHIKVISNAKNTPLTIIELFKFGSRYEVQVDQATHGIGFNSKAIKKFNEYLNTGYKFPVVNSANHASFMYQKFKTLKLAQVVFDDCETWVKDMDYYQDN